MKQYLPGLFFLLLCWTTPLSAQQGKKSLAEYIGNLPIESSTQLVLQVGFINNKVPPNIARLVNLEELVILTDYLGEPSKYIVEYLEDSMVFSDTPEHDLRIILPPELFALPALKTLRLDGSAQYSLKPPLPADNVKTGIRKLSIYAPYKEAVDFWPILQNLEELAIYSSTAPELNEAVYSLKKLKKLKIHHNAATVVFDERLNRLIELKSINVNLGSVVWPKDMSGMTGLKSVSAEYCGYAPELINGREYYFPAGLYSLPNLEYLFISMSGRLELPPRQTSLTKLKGLHVDGGFYSDLEDKTYPSCLMTPMEKDDTRHFPDLNNITDYSSLEHISIDVGVADIDELKKLRWLKDQLDFLKFDINSNIWLARKIKMAYQTQKMPNLKIIYLPDFYGPEPKPVFKVAGYDDGGTKEAIDELIFLHNWWFLAVIKLFA